MNPILKEHLISATQTFLASFLTIVGASLSAGNIAWSTAFVGALLLSAARGALKEVFAKFAPLSFGGRVGPTILGRREY